MRQKQTEKRRIPRAAYTILIVTAACAGLLYQAFLLTSQLLVIAPRAAAANSWPADPSEATVAFYREMIDLHDQIINVLYAPDGQIEEKEEATKSEARLATIPANVAPVTMHEEKEATVRKVIATVERAEEARTIMHQETPAPAPTVSPANEERRAEQKPNHPQDSHEKRQGRRH